MVGRGRIGSAQPLEPVAWTAGSMRCECRLVYTCDLAPDRAAVRARAGPEIFKARPERVAQKWKPWCDGSCRPPYCAGGCGNRLIAGSTGGCGIDGQELSAIAIG